MEPASPIAGQGDQQLVVLASGGCQLQRLASPSGDLGDAVRDGHAVQIDLQPALARGGDVSGVGTQAVADVDHRRRPLGSQRTALLQPGNRVELPREQPLADAIRE